MEDGQKSEKERGRRAYSASDDIIGATPDDLAADANGYFNFTRIDNHSYKITLAGENRALDLENGKNAYYTPVFMVKLAHVYNAQKNHQEEANLYQEIVEKYPEFLSNSGFNIKKDLERAKILAGNK